MDQKSEGSKMFSSSVSTVKRNLNSTIELELSPQEPPFYSPISIKQQGKEIKRFSVPSSVVEDLYDSFNLPSEQFKAKLKDLKLTDLLHALEKLSSSSDCTINQQSSNC